MDEFDSRSKNKKSGGNSGGGSNEGLNFGWWGLGGEERRKELIDTCYT
jgi:hypothetical protein